MGERKGILLVARVGDALEDQVTAPGHEEGGMVWRRDVLRGMKRSSSFLTGL